MDYAYLLFSLTLTILGYNFVKYVPLVITGRFDQHREVIWFSAISLVINAYYFLQLDFENWLILAPFILLTFLYVFPLSGTSKNLRMLPGLKIFIIATVWTGITYLAPLFYLKTLPDYWAMESAKRFMLLLILMIPFEIRDMNGDVADLKTLPQQVGVKTSKHIGYLLTMLFCGVSFGQHIQYGTFYQPELLISLLLFLMLAYTKKKQHRYYCSFWVEAIPILYLGLYVFSI